MPTHRLESTRSTSDTVEDTLSSTLSVVAIYVRSGESQQMPCAIFRRRYHLLRLLCDVFTDWQIVLIILMVNLPLLLISWEFTWDHSKIDANMCSPIHYAFEIPNMIYNIKILTLTPYLGERPNQLPKPFLSKLNAIRCNRLQNCTKVSHAK